MEELSMTMMEIDSRDNRAMANSCRWMNARDHDERNDAIDAGEILVSSRSNRSNPSL